jgi:hypothetical protein
MQSLRLSVSPVKSTWDFRAASKPVGWPGLAVRRSYRSVETLLMHPVYLAKLMRRTFLLLAVISVMNKPDQTLDDRFAFFSREELLEQQCLLLESELAVMGEELTASREKIATLVLMWTGVKAELQKAETELTQARYQLQVGSAAH